MDMVLPCPSNNHSGQTAPLAWALISEKIKDFKEGDGDTSGLIDVTPLSFRLQMILMNLDSHEEDFDCSTLVAYLFQELENWDPAQPILTEKQRILNEMFSQPSNIQIKDGELFVPICKAWKTKE